MFLNVYEGRRARLIKAEESGASYPPEARIKDISNDGVLELKFTQEMVWPEDLLDSLQKNKRNSRLLVAGKAI